MLYVIDDFESFSINSKFFIASRSDMICCEIDLKAETKSYQIMHQNNKFIVKIMFFDIKLISARDSKCHI